MLFLLFGTTGVYAQFPAEGINYQAVARDAQGAVITTPVGVRISIYSNSPTGVLQYQETHNATPNSYGLFNISIGQGIYVTGAVTNFSQIDWGTGAHYAKTEVDAGSGYLDMGTTQLWAVPYALYAKNAGNASTSYSAGSGITITGSTISAVDNSTTNELQNLTLSGNNLSISNGNSVTLPSGGASYSAGAGIDITGSTITALDNSATNEIQSLSLSGTTLSISGSNSVNLPSGGTTYTAGSGITISGTTISALDNSVTNEIQTLSLSGNNLTISGGNSIALPTGGGTLDQAYDFGGAGAGKTITADSGPVTINGSGTGATNIGLLVNHGGSSTAAIGANFSGTGNAIQAVSSNAANSFATIQASSNSSTTTNSAIFGQSTGAARAVSGQVESTATADAAVRGNNLRTTGGIGVEGVGFNGVSGQTNYREGYGVFGQNFDLLGSLTANSVGVGGVGYIGVLGQSNDNINGAGIASLDNIIALGTLTVSGTKNFRIDHPTDPENKYLNHFSIESNEVLNIYRGTIAFDANGEAVVQLPEWFDDVNRNPSYQLTPIGGYAAIYIKEKIQDGRFVIAGGQAGMEVSWAVYAERNDAFLQQHPEARTVEQEKTAREKGHYLRPDLYNQPAEKGILRPFPTQEK